jgi:hypothetical protein
MLANALAEVGTYERGTNREKQRILSYWDATDSQPLQRLWAGAFVAWIVKQAGMQLPNGPAALSNWRSWGDGVSADAASPGMIGIFTIPGLPSGNRGGFVLRRQHDCIEIVAGNVGNRVVITCAKLSSLVAIRRPHLGDVE